MPRAGLSAVSVTEAGAALADEVGFARLSMGLLADRLGVKTPSLYKHVGSLADLSHRIAVVAATELGDAIRDATQGRAGSDALAAAAHAMRSYVKEHPGRYAAGNAAMPGEDTEAMASARRRMLDSFSAVLLAYDLGPDREIHALRLLRSLLHGFATLEVEGGFQMGADVDESFTWIMELVDLGLRQSGPAPSRR